MSPQIVKSDPQTDNRQAFFTVPQVAQRQQRHPLTIRRDIAAGKLAAHRFGKLVRISAEALAKYEQEGGREA